MRRLVFLLFFLSGALGLAYQVVWTRMMTHAFGTTALAVGTVLAAFMSGLAVGSWLIGKAVDRSANPLRLYALLEIGVAVAALVAHFLLGRIPAMYVGVYELFGRSDAMLGLARFVLAFVLVMAPTVLMGATLPVLARFVLKRMSGVGAGLSTLYAINTIGAVAGTLLTGFFLIGAVGIERTVQLAVLGNLLIGATAWIASSRVPLAAGDEAPEAAQPIHKSGPKPGPGGAALAPGVFRLVLLGLVLSGFTSFAYEIYWTRSLVFLLGNSTYAVSSMLTAFLLGIALGGFLVRFVMDRVRDRAALFGWIQILIAVSSAMALPLLFSVADPETIRVYMGESVGRSVQLVTARFGVALVLMLVPASLIGATFPLVGRIAVTDLRQTGAVVGRVYALNTLGNVVGALVPGVFLISWLGIQTGIVTMAALNALIGFAVLSARFRELPSVRWSLPGAVLLTAVVFASAPFGFQFPAEAQTEWHRVVYYREGPSATTKVLLEPDTRDRSMSVDGVAIGGTAFTEFKQLLLAHLPKLLADDVGLELSIGLGSGMLIGESLRHERVERAVCAEIEPSVIEGAEYFVEENHGVLRDPRLELVLDDVANHLRTTANVYDVISADEKTAQEYASNGFSYSREYYELLRERLAPHGMVAQWVPTTLPPSQYLMVLRTFTAAFPHAQLWFFSPAYQDGAANTILVGTLQPLEPKLDDVRRRLEADPAAFESVARYGLTSAEGVLAHFVAGGEILANAVRIAPENTLEHPRYEFYSPEDYAGSRTQRLVVNLGFLADLRQSAAPGFLSALKAGTESDTTRLDEAFAGERAFEVALRASLANRKDDEVLHLLDEALSQAPWNDSLRARIFVQVWYLTSKYTTSGEFARAAQLMQSALQIHDAQGMAHVNFAIVLMRLGEGGLAIQTLQRALELEPQLVAAHRTLAELLQRAGRREEALAHWRALLAVEPADEQARIAIRG